MNRQFKLGNGLVLLACLMVLICINQRAVGERLFANLFASHSAVQVHPNTGSPFSYTEQQNDSNSNHSTCELSAKSLLTLIPAVIEPLFFVFLSLAAIMIFCTNLFIYRAKREEKHAPPRVRLHLQYCNLRN